MTEQGGKPRDSALHASSLSELEAALEEHLRAQRPAAAEAGSGPHEAAASGVPGSSVPQRRWRRLASTPRFVGEGALAQLRSIGRALASASRRRSVRRVALAFGAAAGVLVLLCGVLLWRLSNGPISLDLATPWLTAAIEENFGNRYRVSVGGTQLERNNAGRSAIRLRDIAVRDAEGRLVARAPKAEVGIAGTSLLVARPRAESMRLVEANVLIRVETDGRIDIFADGERPFASIAAPTAVGAAPASGSALQKVMERSAATNVVAFLAWADSLSGAAGQSGFDGRELNEIGVINGRITIDDRREARVWRLDDVDLRLTRTKANGVSLRVGSDSETRPWSLSAALTPARQGLRGLQLDMKQVLLDDLLALRIEQGGMRSDTRVTGLVEALIRPDGALQTLSGSLLAQGGSLGRGAEPADRVPIERAEVVFDWDRSRGTLRAPLVFTSGATRVSLRAEAAAPRAEGEPWLFAVGSGWILLDRSGPREDDALALKRIAIRGRIDTAQQRIVLDQGDIGTGEFGGSREKADVSLALSGQVSYAGADPVIAMGLAGNRMTVANFKRLWPSMVLPDVRAWMAENVLSGSVDRIEIATRTPLAALTEGGPPLADDGLSATFAVSGAVVRPVDGLPVIRDADLTAQVTGRTATVTLGKGVADVSAGRRLTLSNGVFEVPDTSVPQPPARVRLRVEGSVPAAAELLNTDRLRDFAGSPFDPGTSRGNVAAQVTLSLPLRADLPRGSTNFNVSADLTNFVADKLAGYKVEAQALRITAHNQAVQFRGDVRINGTVATLDYRKNANEPDAELKLAANLDEAARVRLGMDFGIAVAGTLPVKLSGRVTGADTKEPRFAIEADLTPIRIVNLLPGWVKDRGKPARVSFNLSREKGVNRLDDLLIDGQGVLAKGSLEVDSNGDIQSASFPVFATSDGDKATIKVDRDKDGLLKVVMRGDVYDGRNFIKTTMAGSSEGKSKSRQADVDLDIKLGVVAGHNGEAVRGLDLRMTRRGGRIRAFNLNAKIGRDTALLGDMRTRTGTARPLLYFETNDAGALFRLTDVYPRMTGGRIWVAMDPPTPEQSPQEGLINVRDFTVRGESALDRVASQQNAAGTGVAFTQARAEFTKVPGRLMVRDGVVRGPVIGATIEGSIDYARDEASMRGTFVPLYGLNNMFGQIPIVGLFLGGSNEGLLGLTFEVTGPTNNPRVAVNPLSAIAPGLLRKFFEFRDTGGNERAFTDPNR